MSADGATGAAEGWQAQREARPPATAWRVVTEAGEDRVSLTSAAVVDDGGSGYDGADTACAFPDDTPSGVVAEAQALARSQAARMLVLLQLHPSWEGNYTARLVEAAREYVAVREQDDPGSKALKSSREYVVAVAEDSVRGFRTTHEAVVNGLGFAGGPAVSPVSITLEGDSPREAERLAGLLADALAEVRRQDALLEDLVVDVTAPEVDTSGDGWVAEAWRPRW